MDYKIFYVNKKANTNLARVRKITSNGKFASFYHILNTKISPEGASTDCTEMNDRNTKLIDNINRKAQATVC